MAHLSFPYFPTLSAASLLFAPTVFATGIEQAFQSTEAMGKGNVGVASVDDVTAVHYNPAGLAQLDRWQIQSNSYLFYGNPEYDFVGGGTFDPDDEQLALTGSTFLGGPVGDNLAVGFGLTLPFGLSADYGDDHPLRHLSVEGQLIHLRATAVLAWEIRPGIRLGGGAVFAYEDIDVVTGFPMAANPFGLGGPGDSSRLEGDGTAWGYTIGAQFDMAENHTLGITFRSGINMETTGRQTGRLFVPNPTGGAPLLAPAPGFDARTVIPYPDQLAVGYAITHGDWTFETNLTHSFRGETVVFEAVGQPAIEQTWDDTTFVNFGVTYQLTDYFQLRTGYLYSDQGVPDQFNTPTLADGPYHGFTIGSGYQKGNWQIDNAISLGIREDNETPLATYKSVAVGGGMGITYTF